MTCVAWINPRAREREREHTANADGNDNYSSLLLAGRVGIEISYCQTISAVSVQHSRAVCLLCLFAA